MHHIENIIGIGHDVSSPKELKQKTKVWLREQLYKRLPILVWLPVYDWKENFLFDMISGVTVAFVYIAQGLAFSILAQVSPVYGLYTASFLVVIYCIFGTATVCSIGPVSVASMLTGTMISSRDFPHRTNDEVVLTVNCLLGLFYLFAFVFRLHIVVSLFSKPLVAAFFLTTGVQIFAQTLITMGDFPFNPDDGYFCSLVNLYNIGSRVDHMNFVSFTISLTTLSIFFTHAFFIKPHMKKVTSLRIPIEALIMIFSVSVSHLIGLSAYGVRVVGNIPSGLPRIAIPNFELDLVWEVASSAAVVALCNYFTSVSMSKALNPNIKLNQELLAYAICNIFGSFIQCLPFGNSVMRSVIARTSGCKSLVSNITSAVCVFCSLFWTGPLLSPLPLCIMGCLTLTGIIYQIHTAILDIPRIYDSGKEDLFIWFVTVIIGMSITVQSGMFIGLVFRIRQLLYHNNRLRDQVRRSTQVEDSELKTLLS